MNILSLVVFSGLLSCLSSSIVLSSETSLDTDESENISLNIEFANMTCIEPIPHELEHEINMLKLIKDISINDESTAKKMNIYFFLLYNEESLPHCLQIDQQDITHENRLEINIKLNAIKSSYQNITDQQAHSMLVDSYATGISHLDSFMQRVANFKKP